MRTRQQNSFTATATTLLTGLGDNFKQICLEQEVARTHNRRLAQWRVTWLIEHSTSHLLLWCIDSFVLRNPPLRQAPKRYASPYETTVLTLNRQKE